MTVDTPLRRSDLAVEILESEAHVFDPKTGTTHVLNPSAYAIFELCDGATTVNEMAEALATVTPLGVDEALRQVEELIAVFSEKDLLQID
jgi:PqqD family protein of HPr-rel-A system